MCVVDLDHCDCSCHYMEGVSHIMTCCDGGVLVPFRRQRRRSALEEPVEAATESDLHPVDDFRDS